MDLLSAFLDIVDAVSTAFGIVVVWYSWVAPPRNRQERIALPPPRRPSAPDELDDFLRSAASGRAGDSLA